MSLSSRNAKILLAAVIAGAVTTATVLAHVPRGPDAHGPAEAPPEDEVWLSQEQMQKAGIQVAVAQEHDLPQAVRAGGTIAFDDLRVTHVFSPVTGRITRVLAQPGQRLKKGAALLALVSPDVGQFFSDVVKAQANVVATEADFHRQTRLYRDGAAAERDLEQAEDAFRTARAEYERAQQKASMLRNGAVDIVTQEYTLKSYIDGEVIARMANPGIEVQGQYSGGSSVELFTIGDIKEVWVFADVQDMDLPRVQLGSNVAIRVIAYPDRVFHGKVDWISGAVDPVLRTAKVRCVLPNENEELKPGMFAAVDIQQPPLRRLAVPDDAVDRVNESSFAFVEDGTRPDGKLIFKRRQVTAGEQQDGLVPVLDGLHAGERVVTQGSVSRDQPNDEAWISPQQLKEAHITVELAREVDLPDAVSIGGRLTFDDLRVSHVFSPVNGRITRVLAQLGQRVEKGTPLLAIKSPDVGQFFSDVVKAQAGLVAAEHEYQRQKDLYSFSPTVHAGTLKDLEAAEANWRNAKAELERAKQKTQLLRAGDLDAVTQDYILRSPISGEVIARMANPGLEVQGQYSIGSNVVELFTIGETDKLWVIGDVYELDRPHITEGDDVTVTVSAFPGKTFRGVVDWVADVLDPVLRTAKVRCVIDNPERLLKAELYESISITVPGKQVLVVPRHAVMRSEDDVVVFVSTGQTRNDGSTVFKRRKVVANLDGDGSVVPVLSGLHAGETIAVDNSVLLLGLL
jgi:cobalt-zinc-cadmium efflux system membrane fusion protein